MYQQNVLKYSYVLAKEFFSNLNRVFVMLLHVQQLLQEVDFCDEIVFC